MKNSYSDTGIVLGRYMNPIHDDGPQYLRLKNYPGVMEEMKKSKIILQEDEFNGQDPNHVWTIDKSTLLMENDVIDYPVAVGKNGDTPEGEFIVAELWKNPYWIRRKNKTLYLPGVSNPIGDFLVILADPVSGKKISQSIHKWSGYPVNKKEFRPGNGTEGCVVLNESCMRDFSKRVQLADRIIITKDKQSLQTADAANDFSRMHLDDPKRMERIMRMISDEGQMAMCA